MGYLTTVSNAGVTNTGNITTVSNSVVTNMGYLTTVSNAGVTTSNNLTTVSNSGVTNATNIGTVTTNLTTVSNAGVTNTGNITAVSNAGVTTSNNLTTVSNTVAAGRFANISTNTISTNLIIAGYVSSPQGYISSLTVDYLAIGSNYGYVNMGDIIATSMSSLAIQTQTLTTGNLQVGTVSSLSYIAFPGLQQGYTQSVVAEQSTGTGLQELLIFRGSTTTDRIRMQTTGSIIFEPGVSARVFPAAPSNVTPAMIITTGSNVGIGIAAPGVSLDVAGAGRFTALSTNTVSTNQINSSNICNAGWLSNGGALSNLGGTAYFAATSNTTTLGVAQTATFASNVNIYGGGFTTNGLTWTGGVTHTLWGDIVTTGGKYIQWDYTTGTLITDNTKVAITAPIINLTGTTTLGTTYTTTLSNSGNFCNAGWLSNGGALSNLGGTAYFAATSNTTTLGVAQTATFASNITQTAGTTVLTGLSVNTISTNFVVASNISTNSMSTNYGFFSTISVGTMFGKYLGDGSGLTGISGSGGSGVTNILSTNQFFVSSISTATIQTSNIRVGTLSTNSYVSFPGLAKQYSQSILAEQETGTGLQEMLIFRGSSASDRIRLQTTGYICFETGVGARAYPTITSNATPSWMIDVNGCVGVGLIPSGTTNKLDVAGQGRFQNLSTTSIMAGSMNLSVAFV